MKIFFLTNLEEFFFYSTYSERNLGTKLMDKTLVEFRNMENIIKEL